MSWDMMASSRHMPITALADNVTAATQPITTQLAGGSQAAPADGTHFSVTLA
jgi:hypothetical protein